MSCARSDKGRVTPLVAALEAQGWSVWSDPAIAPGPLRECLAMAGDIDAAIDVANPRQALSVS